MYCPLPLQTSLPGFPPSVMFWMLCTRTRTSCREHTHPPFITATGQLHVCAIMISLGGLRCWGFSYYGQVRYCFLSFIRGPSHIFSDLKQLGNGGILNVFAPPSSNVLTGVVQVVCGEQVRGAGIRPRVAAVALYFMTVILSHQHTCALLTTTGIRCW